uniref:Uncharacterized protein n=1 Tax=Timema shepardi TaxID=629360 RepID=A0A7R9G0E2_TIMSH|nr:unnamed protein product [Timema shepardi]
MRKEHSLSVSVPCARCVCACANKADIDPIYSSRVTLEISALPCPSHTKGGRVESSPMRFFYRIYEVDASSDDTNCCFDVVQETSLEAPVKLSTILEVPDEESSDVTSESQEASGTSYGGRQDEPASGESSQGSKTGENDATNRDDPGLPPATNSSEKRDISKTKYPTFTFRLPEPPQNSPSPGPNTPSHPRSPRPSSDQIISNIEDPKHTSQDQGGEVDATKNNISSSSHSTPRDPSPTSPGPSTSPRTNVASIDANTPSTLSKENPTGALSDRGKETCTVLTSKKQDDPSCISVTKEKPTSSNVGRCEVASTLSLISKQAIEKSVERDTISIVPVKETVPKIISNISAAKPNIKPSILPQSGKKPIILCKNGSESTTISNTTLLRQKRFFPVNLQPKDTSKNCSNVGKSCISGGEGVSSLTITPVSPPKKTEPFSSVSKSPTIIEQKSAKSPQEKEKPKGHDSKTENPLRVPQLHNHTQQILRKNDEITANPSDYAKRLDDSLTRKLLKFRFDSKSNTNVQEVPISSSITGDKPIIKRRRLSNHAEDIASSGNKVNHGAPVKQLGPQMPHPNLKRPSPPQQHRPTNNQSGPSPVPKRDENGLLPPKIPRLNMHSHSLPISVPLLPNKSLATHNTNRTENDTSGNAHHASKKYVNSSGGFMNQSHDSAPRHTQSMSGIDRSKNPVPDHPKSLGLSSTINALLDSGLPKTSGPMTDRPKTPASITDRPKTPGLVTDRLKTPGLTVDRQRAGHVIDRPKTPGQVTDRPKTPGQHTERTKDSGSTGEQSKNRGPNLDRPKTPAASGDRPKTPALSGDQSKSPGPSGDHSKTSGGNSTRLRIQIPDRPKTPGQNMDRPKTPASATDPSKTSGQSPDAPKTPVLNMDCTKTLGPSIDNPRAQGAGTDRPKTPGLITDRPKTPGHGPDRPKTPSPGSERPKTPGSISDRPKTPGLNTGASRPQSTGHSKKDGSSSLRCSPPTKNFTIPPSPTNGSMLKGGMFSPRNDNPTIKHNHIGKDSTEQKNSFFVGGPRLSIEPSSPMSRNSSQGKAEVNISPPLPHPGMSPFQHQTSMQMPQSGRSSLSCNTPRPPLARPPPSMPRLIEIYSPAVQRTPTEKKPPKAGGAPYSKRSAKREESPSPSSPQTNEDSNKGALDLSAVPRRHQRSANILSIAQTLAMRQQQAAATASNSTSPPSAPTSCSPPLPPLTPLSPLSHPRPTTRVYSTHQRLQVTNTSPTLRATTVSTTRDSVVNAVTSLGRGAQAAALIYHHQQQLERQQRMWNSTVKTDWYDPESLKQLHEAMKKWDGPGLIPPSLALFPFLNNNTGPNNTSNNNTSNTTPNNNNNNGGNNKHASSTAQRHRKQ